MKNELDIVSDVSRKLEQVGVHFMLTGSMALNYYAQPRFTRDIDMVIELGPDKIPSFVEIFAPEYYVEEEDVRRAVRAGSQFNLIHTESVIKVDCILRKKSEHAVTEFARRKAVEIQGTGTTIASIEDLILAKLSWAAKSGSEIQRADVRNLLSKDHDRAYVEAWAARLGLAQLLQECRQ
jgi:hypothetical protein